MVAWNKVAGSGQPLIPYDNHGRDVVRAWNHFRRAKPVHLDINIARHVNLPKSKARSLTDFAFLPYVASNWLWHSIDFAYGGAIGGDSAHRQKQKVRRDTLFRDLAVQKQLLFEFRPWGTFDDNNQKLSSIALLGWALMTNHSYLISMTSIDEELLRPPVLILEAYRWFRDDVIEPTNAPRVTDAHLVRLKAFSEDSYSLESPELGWLYSRMLCAARRGHLDVIQACGLTIHEKLDYFWGHLIVEAAAAGQASFIKWVHENLALDSSFTDFTVTHESNHYSAIERSLLAGQTEALIALSRLGYPVNTLLPDEASFYKLMDTAIHDKNVKVTESLLFLLHEHSSPVFAQINMKGPEISDLFLNAVKIGNKCVIDVMLKHGIGPDIQDKNGLTALVVAITASHLQLVETLLQRGCKTGNTRFGLPLTIATCLGSLEIASLLVEYGAEIFKDESNYANDLVFFEQFSIDDAEPATHLCLSPTPLYMAAYCGHREITEMLIRRGAAVNVASPAALFSFTDQNTFPDIDRLTWDIDLSLQNIGRLADIDPRSWNEKGFSRWEYPITVAVVEGHSEIVSLLLGAGSTTSRLSPSQIDNQPNDWLRAKVREAPSVRNDFRHGDACQIEYKLFTNFFLSISRISYRQCEILIAGGGKTSIILDRLRYGPFLYALQAGHRMMAERMFRDIPAQSLGRLSFRGIKTMLNAGDGIQIPDPILIAAAQAGNLEVRTEFIKWGAEAVVRVFNDLNNCNPEDRERNFEMFHLITSSIIHESWLVTLDMCSYYKILRRVAQCDNTSAELVMKLLSLLVSQRRTGISQIEPILHYAFATGRGRKMLRALLEFGRLVQLIGDDRDEELLTAILWNHIQAVNGLIEAKFDFRRAFFVRALDLCVSLERENIWKRLIGWKEQAPHGPSNTITLHLIFERQRADNIRLPPTLCHGINCEPGDVGTEAPVGLISHAISTDQGSIPSENSAKGFETCATNGSSALVYRKPDDKSDDQEAPAKYVQHLTLPIYAVARGEYLLSLPCRSVPGLFELA
jgi:ankyrin repeat protein